MSGRLALLWHLHQPDYRDPRTGRPFMPWVRLHALRGYRDLFVESVERDAKVTLNVVPSLLDQLDHYAAGGDDRHLELSRRVAESLSPDEVEEAVRTLPAGHPMMTDAWPVWRELRSRIEAGERRVGAIRDLQVWSTLCWMGATARRDLPLLTALSAQGRDFSAADQAELFAAHDALLADLPARISALVAAPGPALSTTPYFHPILPLLIDARHARRCMPDLPDEVDFAWPQDALRQLVDARTSLARRTGKAPIGLWPSEGSVSPEVVALAAEAGFGWLASDRAVLRRSDRAPATSHSGPWDLGHGVRGFFRDTELSDRIGFRYATVAADRAVADLIGEAQRRADDGVLLVALDGENPWESFADAGGAFRQRLYDALESGPLRGITLDEASAEAPIGSVGRLHTGSWIGADFRIWIGHADDRRAWRALAAARAAAEVAGPVLRERAMPHLMAAEGSDWTWWYGDDFRTEWAGAFDALFRAHLRAAWRAIDREPPSELDQSLRGDERPEHTPPRRLLPIDWTNAHTWIAWAGAGVVRPTQGSMASATAVRSIAYGWDAAGDLWIALDAGGTWRLVDDAAETRDLGGPQVARVTRGDSIQFEEAGGARWPDAPLKLAHPERPSLALWTL